MGLFDGLNIEEIIGKAGSLGGFGLGLTGIGGPLTLGLLAAGSSLATQYGQEKRKKEARNELKKSIEEQRKIAENSRAEAASKNRSAWNKAAHLAGAGQEKAASAMYGQEVSANTQAASQTRNRAMSRAAELKAEKGKYGKGNDWAIAGKALAEGAASYVTASALGGKGKNPPEPPKPPKPKPDIGPDINIEHDVDIKPLKEDINLLGSGNSYVDTDLPLNQQLFQPNLTHVSKQILNRPMRTRFNNNLRPRIDFGIPVGRWE
jgi:hypothetical protein